MEEISGILPADHLKKALKSNECFLTKTVPKKRKSSLPSEFQNESDETNKEPNTLKLFKSKVTIIKRSDIVNKSTWYLTNIS